VTSADERIAKLEAQVAFLLQVIAARDATVAKLEARVRELEEQLWQNSTNSHKPPSSDPPGTRPAKPSTGRRRGGQPGHKHHKRVMLPATRRTDLRPRACRCCGGRRLAALPDERVHQVVDVPTVQPDVHDIVMHGASCRDCGKTTWAELPRGVPSHMFGPRLLGLIGYLVGARISRRQVREILGEVFAIPVSLGALSEAEEHVSNALAAPVDEAATHVRGQPIKHVDASTWRMAGAYAALWTIATRLVTVFFIAGDGRKDTVKALLGNLRGILVTDRGSQFGFWAMERRQVCWAHLIRKFVAFTERGDHGAALGDSLLLIAQTMLHEWHRVRDGTRSRASYRVMADNAQVAFERLLERGVALRLRGLSGACADILAHRAALFTFARERGVEPTNNHAERALRPFVLWRKTSYGSQSERGRLFAERVMTVAHTLRLQKRSVLAFLVDACHAKLHNRSTPTLLPAIR